MAAVVFLLFLLLLAIAIGVGVGVGVTQSGSGGGGSSTTVDGSCGFADGIVTNSTPSTNLLCSAGTATQISGGAPWAWACLGSNGGGNSSCATVQDPPELAGLIQYAAPQNAPTITTTMGITLHDTEDLNLVAQAGFGWGRTDTDWGSVETVKGVYDFTRISNFSDSLAFYNLKPLWILDYGNSLYSDSSSNPAGLPIDAYSLAGFVNFTRAVVNFLPKGQAFEIWNEWEGFGPLNATQYARLCNAVAPVIHSIDPTATVISTSPSGGVDYNGLKLWLEAGGVKGLNGTGLHVYDVSSPCTKGCTGSPEYLFDFLDQWEAIKASFNVTIPTWITEGGIYEQDIYPITLENQAFWVLRYLLTNWATGAPIGVLYDKDDGYWSFQANNYTIAAVTVLSNFSKGRVFTGFVIPWRDPYVINAIRMASDTDVVYALWMEEGLAVNVTVPEGSQAFDTFGRPFTTGSYVTVQGAPVSGPIYLQYGRVE